LNAAKEKLEIVIGAAEPRLRAGHPPQSGDLPRRKIVFSFKKLKISACKIKKC
jgi:hypothetical protein